MIHPLSDVGNGPTGVYSSAINTGVFSGSMPAMTGSMPTGSAGGSSGGSGNGGSGGGSGGSPGVSGGGQGQGQGQGNAGVKTVSLLRRGLWMR